MVTLRNSKISSEIRCDLASKLDIETLERVLFNHWEEEINHQERISVDATCYESEIRYPTDQKLLWACVQWQHKQICTICDIFAKNILEPPTPWEEQYVGYSKMKRKTRSKRRRFTRGLLKLLLTVTQILDQLETEHSLEIHERYHTRHKVIQKVYTQQHTWFHKGEKPQNRIVSLSKNYDRPIVRGKEIKKYEFGTKVNKLQIDGINFIEHVSSGAFK